MKKTYILKLIGVWAVLALCAYTANAQTTWRVNSNDATADFSQLSTAVQDFRVNDGDVILLEGSNTRYNSIDLNKRLTIIGPGYFLDENPNTSNNIVTARIATGSNQGINFEEGSQGSVVQGLVVGGFRVTVDNISLIGNFVQNNVSIIGSSGIKIRRNYIDGGVTNGTNSQSVEVELLNNIIDGNVESSGGVFTQNNLIFSNVRHNLFLNDCVISAAVFENNIWTPRGNRSGGYFFGVSASTFRNNLAFNERAGNENGNVGYGSGDVVYVSSGSTDGKYKMDADSPFKGMATDGTDPGPFGGSSPYQLSGLPPFPIIYQLSTDGLGSDEEGLPITIKIRMSDSNE